jgi:CRP-like cAMP-binding protein
LSLALRKHIEEISLLTDEEFDFIFSFFKSRSLMKHQFLVQEGELVKNEHWVVKGLLKAYYTSKDGKQHILQFAKENWWITDYQAFTNQTTATIHVDCIEPSEVLYISFTDREKLCATSHKMTNFFRIKSNKGYVALQQRISSLLSNSAEERYSQLINQHPDLFQRVPKALIAAYLGVSRETLSRFSTNH